MRLIYTFSLFLLFSLQTVSQVHDGTEQYQRFIQKLSDKDWKVRQKALISMSYALPYDRLKQAGPSIAKLLKDENSSVKLEAIATIEFINYKNQEVINTLIESLIYDNNPSVRNSAAGTLMKWNGRKAVIEFLKNALKHKELEIRKKAVVTLGEPPVAYCCQIPLLVETMKENYPALKDEISFSLSIIAVHNEEKILPIIAPYLHDEQWYVREAIVRMLDELKEQALPILNEIAEKDPHDKVREAAKKTIKIIEVKRKSKNR